MLLPVPRTADGVAGLAALLSAPERTLIALDFDGTLAPIVADPAQAFLPAGTLAVLGQLAQRVGTLAILTGRPVPDVLRLGRVRGAAGLAALVVLGQYGLQRWDADTGRTTAPEPDPGVAAVRERLPGLVAGAGLDATSVEDKQHAVAVHTRRAAHPQQALEQLRGPLEELAAGHGLETVPGKFVLEMRPPGTDKGGALRSLVAERSTGAVLFAGDDLGDLPAYDAVEALRTEGVPGVTVCSASDEVTRLQERADVVVPGPAGISALLEDLVAAMSGR